jgi:hypothetical protein
MVLSHLRFIHLLKILWFTLYDGGIEINAIHYLIHLSLNVHQPMKQT